MKGYVIDIVAVIAFSGGIAGNGIEHPMVFAFGKGIPRHPRAIDAAAALVPRKLHAAHARKRDSRIAGKPPKRVTHPLHGEPLIIQDTGVSFKTGNLGHNHIPLRPYRYKQIVRRLEQVVKPLRVRKPDLVHRRDRDSVLVVLLEREQVVVAVIPRFKIESPVLSDGVTFRAELSPLPAGGPPIYRARVVRIRGLRHVALPSDFLLVVEVQPDLPQPVRHQVVHHERVPLYPVVHRYRGNLVALHMPDGDGLPREFAVRRQTVHALPAVHLHPHLRPVRFRLEPQRRQRSHPQELLRGARVASLREQARGALRRITVAEVVAVPVQRGAFARRRIHLRERVQRMDVAQQEVHERALVEEVLQQVGGV